MASLLSYDGFMLGRDVFIGFLPDRGSLGYVGLYPDIIVLIYSTRYCEWKCIHMIREYNLLSIGQTMKTQQYRTDISNIEKRMMLVIVEER